VTVRLLKITLTLPADYPSEGVPSIDALPLPDGSHLALRTGVNEHAGTGGVVWPCSRALCRWMGNNVHDLRGARVLELGAGTGVCGIYAAALGASRVLLTDDDRPALLSLARSNVSLNAGLYAEGADIQVQALVWGQRAAMDVDQFDVVLGSDLTHLNRGCWLLCETLTMLLKVADHRRPGKRPPRVVLAHQDRQGEEGSRAQFLDIASQNGLVVTELWVDRDPSDGYPPVPVAILEVTVPQYQLGS
jgi:predicted nicotinamide N-methyase